MEPRPHRNNLRPQAQVPRGHQTGASRGARVVAWLMGSVPGGQVYGDYRLPPAPRNSIKRTMKRTTWVCRPLAVLTCLGRSCIDARHSKVWLPPAHALALPMELETRQQERKEPWHALLWVIVGDTVASSSPASWDGQL